MNDDWLPFKITAWRAVGSANKRHNINNTIPYMINIEKIIVYLQRQS